MCNIKDNTQLDNCIQQLHAKEKEKGNLNKPFGVKPLYIVLRREKFNRTVILLEDLQMAVKRTLLRDFRIIATMIRK